MVIEGQDPHVESAALLRWLAKQWAENGMNPGNMRLAITTMNEVMIENQGDWPDVLRQIVDAFPKWLEFWASQRTEARFRPSVANWLNGQYWQNPPKTAPARPRWSEIEAL